MSLDRRTRSADHMCAVYIIVITIITIVITIMIILVYNIIYICVYIHYKPNLSKDCWSRSFPPLRSDWRSAHLHLTRHGRAVLS